MVLCSVDLVKWTTEQRQAIARELHSFISVKKIPRREDCEKCIANCPVLQNMTWRRIKDQVNAQIQVLRRRERH